MATNDPLLGHVLAGRYRLETRRGKGGHGIVMDAVDLDLQRPVAVKIMLPQFAATTAAEARFRAEAQVAGAMSHPNLNAVYDWGVEVVEGARVPFLVLERLSGGSLRDMLDRGRLLSPSQALMVGLDVCRGLEYMHGRGVIHRDLKPANLAFGDDRHVRLLDVGVSRLVADETWREPSAAGIDAARYASPEQGRGGNPQDGTLDSATDIYSLSLVLIEAVTGQVPFASDSTVATLNARNDKLMPVSADFGPLASVLSRAGSADPPQRYTAAEFGRALVAAAGKLPRPAPLPVVGVNSIDNTGGIRRPTDPTGPMQRPAEATVVLPLVPPAPADDGALSLDAPTFAAPVGAPAVLEGVRSDLPEDVVVGSASLASLLSGPLSTTGPTSGAVARTSGATARTTGPNETQRAVRPVSGATPAISGAVPAVEANLYDQAIEPSRSRRTWYLITTPILLLALAFLASVIVQKGPIFNLFATKSHTVPELAGMAEGVARNEISEYGWRVVVETERNDEQAEGNVIRTFPGTGEKLKEGRAISFVVSLGPTLATLPDVARMNVQDATLLLQKNKLDITIAREVFDETIESGVIISWTVPAQTGLTAGMDVMQRTMVAVVVSKGPAPRPVAKLIGLDEAAAIAALTNVQLVPQRAEDRYSSDIDVGLVMDQSVPEGTQLNRGDGVTYAISLGPELIAVPSLEGQNLQMITATLEAVGLRVGKVTGPKEGGFLTRVSVNDVDVRMGDIFPRGTALDFDYF